MFKKIFVLSLFVISAQACLAQTDTVRLREIAHKSKIVTDRPPQAVYFQLGGSGPILSANYDRRFSNKVNGAGFSAGVGYWSDLGISIFSIPVSINYLIGRRTHFLELAAGTTFVTASFDWFDEPEKGSGFLHHVNMGYRHQPTTGGFFFRGGISPLFAFEGGETYATSVYLGFGYNF